MFVIAVIIVLHFILFVTLKDKLLSDIYKNTLFSALIKAFYLPEYIIKHVTYLELPHSIGHATIGKFLL